MDRLSSVELFAAVAAEISGISLGSNSEESLLAFSSSMVSTVPRDKTGPGVSLGGKQEFRES